MTSPNSNPTSVRSCAWCGRVTEDLDRDHVFPRGIGGTLDFFLWSCRVCQKAIGRAETDLIKRSPASVYRFDVGPGPRKRSRPTSGLVQAKRSLRKTGPGCGYAQVGMRARHGVFEYTSIEICLSTLKARTRGKGPEDVDDLIARVIALRSVPLDKRTGYPTGLNVDFLRDHEDEIRSDPEFWPRVVVEPDDKLTLLARDEQEARVFLGVLTYLCSEGAFSDHSQWRSSSVPAGTPHLVSLLWNPESERQVAAKIAYGVILVAGLGTIIEFRKSEQLRRFVLEGSPGGATLPVEKLVDFGAIAGAIERQSVIIDVSEGRLQGLVTIYGSAFRVDLGKPQDLSLESNPQMLSIPLVAVTSTDEGPTRFLDHKDGEKLRKVIEEGLNGK